MPTAATTTQRNATIDSDRAAALLLAWQRGDPRAAEDLIRLCEPFVRRLVRRCAWRREDVDDIVQEVWLRLYTKGMSIREPKTLLAWLQIVIRRVIVQQGHRDRRLVPVVLPQDDVSPSCTEEEAIARCHREQLTSTVRTAMGSLRHHDQRLLLLLHREERPRYDAIGHQLQRPVGSLGPTRQRLLNQLRNDRRLDTLRDLPAAG